MDFKEKLLCVPYKFDDSFNKLMTRHQLVFIVHSN